MPSRIIREQICDSPTLAALSSDAERLFFRLMVQADDYGTFPADPRIVVGKCVPMLQWDANICVHLLAELERVHAIKYYTFRDRIYGTFINWNEYNKPRAKRKKYPCIEDVDIKPYSFVDNETNGGKKHLHASENICTHEHLQTSASRCTQMLAYSDSDSDSDSIFSSRVVPETLHLSRISLDTPESDIASTVPAPDRLCCDRKSTSRGKKPVHEYPAEVVRICDTLRRAILHWKPDHRLSRPGVYERLASTWSVDVDLLNRVDQVSWERVQNVVSWLAESPDEQAAFWRANVQSGGKLRAQFDTLEARMREAANGKNHVKKQQLVFMNDPDFRL